MNSPTSQFKTVVIAIGGNALVPDNSGLATKIQFENSKIVAQYIADMVEEGWNVVLTHGNGPQVGALLRRCEMTKTELPGLPVDVAVGDTQGEIGYMLQNVIGNELKKRGIQKSIVSVVTQVVVDTQDPAFQNPDKPIGQFMSEAEAKQNAAEQNWTVKEDSGRGWRRVVASPKPQRIVEDQAIQTLIKQGFLVIACGGGGVPVKEDAKQNLTGVEAVIDKDRASAILAAQLKADLFLIPTGVEKIAINFGKPDQLWLEHLSIAEAQKHMSDGQFGAGSMGPKVESILDYLEVVPHGCGLVTNLESVRKALRGETGTRISAKS